MKTLSAYYTYLGTMALVLWAVVFISGVPAYEIAHFKKAPIALKAKGIAIDVMDIELLSRKDALSILGELSATSGLDMGLCVLSDNKRYLVMLNEWVFQEVSAAEAVVLVPNCYLTSEFKYR